VPADREAVGSAGPATSGVVPPDGRPALGRRAARRDVGRQAGMMPARAKMPTGRPRCRGTKTPDSRRVAEAGQPVSLEAPPPEQDRIGLTASSSAIVRFGRPSAARSTIRARVAIRCSVRPAPASARSSARSDSSMTNGGAGWFAMSSSVAAPT
jgi:hypothetical protein